MKLTGKLFGQEYTLEGTVIEMKEFFMPGKLDEQKLETLAPQELLAAISNSAKQTLVKVSRSGKAKEGMSQMAVEIKPKKKHRVQVRNWDFLQPDGETFVESMLERKIKLNEIVMEVSARAKASGITIPKPTIISFIYRVKKGME